MIQRTWEQCTALKGVIEHKDELITQLYNQLSELQEQLSKSESIHSASNTMFSSSTSSSAKHTPSQRDIMLLADREFYAADKVTIFSFMVDSRLFTILCSQDGDGRISREEWRNWIQDKHNLIQEHNQIKNSLMNEIKTLRKALTPTTEKAHEEIKRLEDHKKQLDDQVITSHIEIDRLQVRQ